MRNKFTCVILSCIFIVIQMQLWLGKNSILKTKQIKKNIEYQKIQNEILKNNNKELLMEINDLKKGVEVLEENARINLRMIKEKEIFYIVIINKGQEIKINEQKKDANAN